MDVLELADGGTLVPEAHHSVECHTHGVKTTWGALSPIQQLAVGEGIDMLDELPCILLTENNHSNPL
jgi:hypothetical protein